MKKLLLIIIAVMAFTGLSLAQDIYTCGHFTNSSGQSAVVFKNGTQYSTSYAGQNLPMSSSSVIKYNGDIYWVANTFENSGLYKSTKIYKNVNTTVHTWNDNESEHITDIFIGYNNNVYGVGCKKDPNHNNIFRATYFSYTGTTYYISPNSSYNSIANAGCYGAVISDNKDEYTVGRQFTSNGSYTGKVWKGYGSSASVLYDLGTGADPTAIAIYDNNLYAAGVVTADNQKTIKVWRNGNAQWTMATGSLSNTYTVTSMYIDAGDVYVAGTINDIQWVWKNGEQLFTHSGTMGAVAANSDGVCWAGTENNTGKVYQNNSVLYTLSNCSAINDMYIDEPICNNEQTRTLPYYEGFENGLTDWACWTKRDLGTNGPYNSFWTRAGKGEINSIPSGNYGAKHGFHSTVDQEGWLVSPRLFLQPGQTQTTLTFKTYEFAPSDYRYEGVWISQSSYYSPGSSYFYEYFHEVWTQTSPSSSWKTVTIDLSEYQGTAIYIAFKYTGLDGHVWYIDDINVTESFTPCSAASVPYTYDFSEGLGNCWTAYDVDMEESYGTVVCWYPENGYMYHHPGYEESQVGWLFSRGVTLSTSNQVYYLNFRTATSLGSGTHKNSVWIALDETGAPNPSHYTTKIWEDNAYSSSWTDVRVNIDAYQGHTIRVAFKYEGAPNSHWWYVDDFSIIKGNPCTISVLRDPTEGGTVTGYGTYMMGESCTIGATPNSGWNFINWTRNNNVVSTEPSYTFIVEGNATYTAHFSQAPTQYTITVNANNNAWGTVSGGGQYDAGATCTLHATPASGYQFDSWKKNGSVVSTNPNYSFTVTENATYTAYFSAEPVTYYTITTNVTPTGAGTVTGGGTYPAGSSVTLTATPNDGYAFSQWQDGSTANPRTITVNGDATYTASFTQLQYTITTNVSPAGAGTVTGGGAYHYGEQVTLTATANSGYEFQGWSDGVTNNPRTITVTGNATYTAVFGEVGTTYYNVTTSVSPAGAGTVTGGGTYEAGSVIVLTATANPGYTFNRWDDNSTQNPRTVTVNGDMSFTAIFTQNQYVITVVANPSNAGMVSGGGAYYYGNHATLTATAYSGYEFQGWSDGSTENPHQVLVTDNATYTATFSASGSTYYTVSAYVSPSGAGTVSGTGSFPAGSTTTLTATAYNGYTFDHWNDGVTSPSRTVTVNNNMSFTAYFTANQYTITVNANPSNGGMVTGGDTYTYGATAVLTATPNSGFEFLQWSDGNPNSTRYITVTQNATYTALFLQAGGTVYTLTVTPNYPLLGQTFGSGTYPAGSSVEISAYPSEYAIFVQWSDGNTQNPRTVTVNSNATYTAEFRAAERYTITVESANPSMGEAYGGGTFFEGAVTEISAIPNTGYVFTGWNDGNTQNPRTITVTSNATYTANFTSSGVVTHTLTVMCNTAEGTVSGGGVYVHGATAVIQAFPNPGYTFTKWSDENTQNPRTITVNSDMSLAAFFATGFNETPLSNLKLYPNPATSTIRIAGLEANSSVMIYNSLGELVKVVNADADQEIDVHDLASGLYMVRCGNATLRFVKEL